MGHRRFIPALILVFLIAVAGTAQNSKVCITEQPKPALPPDYGQLDAQASTYLRVEFLSNGKIGSIIVVYGAIKRLSDLAVEAAQNIKFIPAKVDGKPIDSKIILRYYYSWHGLWEVQKATNVYYCSPHPRARKKRH